MTVESGLWGWIYRGIRFPFAKIGHVHRHENSASSGTPDVEGFLNSPGLGQFWIELKSTARPAKAETLVRFKFRPKQVPWLTRRWRLGGVCYLLCQVGTGATAMRYLIEGRHAGDVERGLPESELLRLSVINPTANAVAILTRAAAARIYKE